MGKIITKKAVSEAFFTQTCKFSLEYDFVLMSMLMSNKVLKSILDMVYKARDMEKAWKMSGKDGKVQIPVNIL